ncbi:MAG: thioredoxin [Spirochaetes bacterium GWD1_27_9]|nr:MAG: thioredoxin [Spirochaetes bacterium GWB1_27_13]OHD22012.1 MAG: thioredoxin [Spirochaetes bacterium GWC1_27_15]OHD28645.1 MAG: thioredoxin [Spirochaetes bacterium GWD1_27_9]
MSNEIIIDDSNFETEVLKSDKPVLVDFWAAWCAPCRMLGPIVEDVANEYSGKVKIGKCNVDDNQETASKYGIMSIPTILIFKDGKVVNQSIGVISKENVINLFRKYIESV